MEHMCKSLKSCLIKEADKGRGRWWNRIYTKEIHKIIFSEIHDGEPILANNSTNGEIREDFSRGTYIGEIIGSAYGQIQSGKRGKYKDLAYWPEIFEHLRYNRKIEEFRSYFYNLFRSELYHEVEKKLPVDIEKTIYFLLLGFACSTTSKNPITVKLSSFTHVTKDSYTGGRYLNAIHFACILSGSVSRKVREQVVNAVDKKELSELPSNYDEIFFHTLIPEQANQSLAAENFAPQIGELISIIRSDRFDDFAKSRSKKRLKQILDATTELLKQSSRPKQQEMAKEIIALLAHHQDLNTLMTIDDLINIGWDYENIRQSLKDSNPKIRGAELFKSALKEMEKIPYWQKRKKILTEDNLAAGILLCHYLHKAFVDCHKENEDGE